MGLANYFYRETFRGCSRCYQTKHIDEFSRTNGGRGEPTDVCLLCVSLVQCDYCEQWLHEDNFSGSSSRNGDGKRCRACSAYGLVLAAGNPDNLDWTDFNLEFNSHDVAIESTTTVSIDVVAEDRAIIAAKLDLDRTASAIRWQKDNRERANENTRRWQKNNREKHLRKMRVNSHRRRHAPGKFSAEDIAVKYRDQSGLCFYCGKDISIEYHIEHKIPISREGTNWPDNIVLACPACNREKHTLTDSEYIERKRRATT